jgi:hypothetical protein
VDGTSSSSSSTPSSPSPSSLRWSMLGRFISSRKPGEICHHWTRKNSQQSSHFSTNICPLNLDSLKHPNVEAILSWICSQSRS